MDSIIFNSESNPDGKGFQLATGYCSTTNILFEKQSINVSVEAKGEVKFSDEKGNLLVSANLPEIEEGRGVYENICCKADGDVITLEFPIVKWIDNYPNCDGEYDRWDSVKVGCHILRYNISTNKVELD